MIAVLGDQHRRLFRIGDVEHHEGRARRQRAAAAEAGGEIADRVAVAAAGIDIRNRHRPAAESHADHQQGAPAIRMRRIVGEGADIEGARRAVHRPQMAVAGIGQPAQLRQQIERRVGPQLAAEWMRGDAAAVARRGQEALGRRLVEAGIEGVQQPIVGADIDDIAPAAITIEELGVGPVAIDQVIGFRRCGHRQRH